VPERKALFAPFRVVTHVCIDERLAISCILRCLFTSALKGIVVLSI